MNIQEVTKYDDKTLRNTKWDNPHRVADWLGDNHFEMIGEGYFSQVWKQPGSDQVVKISLMHDKCWTAFAKLVMSNEEARRNPHLPKIKWVLKYGGESWKNDDQTEYEDNHPFLISVIEALEPADMTELKEGMPMDGLLYGYYQGLLRGQLEAAGKAMNWKLRSKYTDSDALRQIRARIQRQDTPMSRAFSIIQELSDRAGCNIDIHEDNVMIRPGTNQLVIIDPIAKA